MTTPVSHIQLPLLNKHPVRRCLLLWISLSSARKSEVQKSLVDIVLGSHFSFVVIQILNLIFEDFELPKELMEIAILKASTSTLPVSSSPQRANSNSYGSKARTTNMVINKQVRLTTSNWLIE